MIAGALLGVAELLLPRVCVACAAPLHQGDRGLVCGRCWARLAPLPAPQCARCGHPVDGRRCRWCDLLPPYLRCGRSVCWTDTGTASAIVHALKYDGWHAVADGMAERMARLTWPEDVLVERTALVPVPLAASRARARGYNQSAMLAHALGRAWQLPVWENVLFRDNGAVSQTRLTPGERRRNVSGVFRAAGAESRRLQGAHLMLVDDVVTTAATLTACARALADAGTRILSFVTFARAPALGDR